MAGHVAGTFLNTDHFAESVTYTPDGGSASSITALVDRGGAEFLPEVHDGSTEIWRASIHVADSDVAMPQRGDQIAATGPDGNAETWNVDSIGAHSDGMWTLECTLEKERAIAGAGSRLKRG